MDIRAKNRDDIWKLIRLHKRFTLTDLAKQSTLHRSSIKTYLRLLIKGGFLQAAPAEERQPIVYTLVKDNGFHPPELTAAGSRKKPNGRQRMWMALKALKRFTFKDLALAASVAITTAREYCHLLRDAGYLRLVRAGRPMCHTELYMFDRAKDTGPLAPRIQKDGALFDRNLGRVVWPESEAA